MAIGVIRSKHQKLILQCYPPGKGVEKKPNPLELSYLLYYALTRRVKLEKVIEFIKHKTIKDVKGRKSGNLQVTLMLVSSLIEKCSDNLNVFAMQVCEILLQILTLLELPLCKVLVSTYGVLCKKLDDGLFSGDKQFVDMFSKLTQQMISVGQMQLDIDSTNSREWRIFALLTARYVFNCLGFNASLSSKFVSLCVPLLARAVSNTYSKDMMLTRLQSNLNVEQETMRPLMRTTTGKSAATNRKPKINGEDESLNDDDLGEEAFAGLTTLFNTLSSAQIAEGIRAIESFCFHEKTIETNWGTTFLQTCASLIPVQMRFVALTTLLNRLAQVSENTSAESKQFVELEHVARYVLALASLDFNMIGLATSDAISQLLTLQKHLYLSLMEVFEPAQVSRLSSIYTRCVCDLSSHIYYFDQVRDSVDEISAHIDSLLINATAENADKIHLLVMRLLETIYVILEKLTQKSNAITRHRGALENLDLSLLLLTISESYSRFSSFVSTAEVTKLQTKYFEVVLYYLKKEIIASNEQSADLQDEPATTTNKFLVPNYNNYIENHDNVIGRLIHHARDYYKEPAFTLQNEKYVSEVLRCVLELTGINFVRNFISYFDLWQLKQSSASINARARDTTAYSLLLSSLSVLDHLYGDVLDSPTSELTLKTSLNADIEMRKSLSLWISDSKTMGSIESGQILKNQVTHDSLCEFFATTSLSQWFHPQTSTIMAKGASRNFMNGSIDGNHSTDTADGEETGRNYNFLAPQTAESGLGLGSANDISSIYSELLHGQSRNNGYMSADTSRITQGSIRTNESTSVVHPVSSRQTMAPRVQDLRHTVNGEDRNDQFLFHDYGPESSLRSVIQRQIQTTNIESLLVRLDSIDDSKLIV